MAEVAWANKYSLNLEKGNAYVVVSRDVVHSGSGGSSFIASCFFLNDGRLLRTSQEERSMDLHNEVRIAGTPEEALEEIMSWVRDNFGENVELTQI